MQDLKISVLRDLLEEHYVIIPVYVSPSDIGHDGSRRPRVYVYCSHRSTGRYLFDIHEAYNRISLKLKKYIHTRPRDYMVATMRDVQLEALRWADKRQKGLPPEPVPVIIVAVVQSWSIQGRCGPKMSQHLISISGHERPQRLAQHA